MLEEQPTRKASFRGFAVIALLSFVLTLIAAGAGWLADFENRTWDWRLQASSESQPPDARIKVIMIDQTSLDHFAQDEIYWPWPRSLYVPLIQFLKQAGAAGVAFDLLFSEGDCHGVGESEQFAAQMDGTIPIVHAGVLRGSRRGNPEAAAAFAARQKQRLDRDGLTAKLLSHPQLPYFEAISLPVPELLERASAVGNVQAQQDSDGIFRRHLPAAMLRGAPVLSLPFALYSAADRQSSRSVLWQEDLRDAQGFLVLRFTGKDGTFPTFPIHQVITSWRQIEEGEKPLLDPASFAGSYVFVGANAPGLLDLRPSPLSKRYAGVYYNATVLDNLLNNRFVHVTSFWSGAALALLVISLITVPFCCTRQLRFQLAGVAVIVLLFTALSFKAAELGYWTPMVAPILGMLATVLASLAYQFQTEGRQHRFIRKAFGHYVSPRIIDGIIRDPSQLSLGGRRREITVFFSDIQGFSSFSEALPPERLALLLNTYLTRLTDIILESGGTLDKYEGDAIIAFWNAPLALPDHAYRAVSSALRCQAAVRSMGDELKKEYGTNCRTRIGIHSGSAIVGNFGSRTRFNYTVIGDSANLAARLEGVNKVFGTGILISGDTQRLLAGSIPGRCLGRVRVVGRREDVEIYEPFSSDQEGAVSAPFEAALQLFESGRLRDALEAFSALPEYPPAQAYVSRLKSEFPAGPPALVSSWQGVWILEHK